MSEKPVVLVTGFGPFGPHKINASWEVVKLLAKLNIDTELGINLIIKEIPVDYKYVRENVPLFWELYKPQLVIHVGVSGVAQEVNLEQQSFNKGYTALDICQHLPENNCCFPDASDCLKSGLDMATICQEINNSGENVFSCVSLDPGQYLCGYTYYISLNIDRDKVAFVHVPVLDKPYSVDQLAGALGQILKLMLAQVHRKSL